VERQFKNVTRHLLHYLYGLTYRGKRYPVTVEERVAVTLWKLATSVEYRTLASLGRSTVGKIDCNVMTMKLLARYVRFPGLHEIVDGFDIRMLGISSSSQCHRRNTYSSNKTT